MLWRMLVSFENWRAVAALGTGLLVFVGTVPADAGLIVVPVSVQASSQLNADRGYARTIDGSGLSDATLVDNGDPVPTAFPAHDIDYNNHWLTVHNDPEKWITFDLGEIVELTGVRVWNYNGEQQTNYTDRGVNGVTIQYSDDGTSYTNEKTTNFARAPRLATYTGETIGLSGSARYVRFDITSTHGNPNYVGLGEVRFIAVPEPASATLCLIGAVSLVLRRRRKETHSRKLCSDGKSWIWAEVRFVQHSFCKSPVRA